MSERDDGEPLIIAHSPIATGRGMLPHRIVIRDMGDQYVVHMEIHEPDKRPWYHQGDYIPKRPDASKALSRAWRRFEERARQTMQLDPRTDAAKLQASHDRLALLAAKARDGDHRAMEHLGDSAEDALPLVRNKHTIAAIASRDDEEVATGDGAPDAEDIARGL